MDLEKRKSYIGGTDCAGILGVSRYKTPLSVWSEKTGRIVPEDISDKLSVKLGVRLEEAVAQLFEDETGKKVRRKNDTLFHPKYSFIGANLDRIVEGEDAILECKTAGAFSSSDWEGEEIPLDYIMQVMHYLAVTGKKYAYIAVLIGGNQSFIWKRIDRDEKVIEQIITKEVEFWNKFVLADIMPSANLINCKDGKTLENLFPAKEPEVEISLGDEANRLIEGVQAMEIDVKLLEKQIDTEKNRLKLLLGENTLANTGIYKITWREQITERIDTKRLKEDCAELAQKYMKESKTRVLRISKNKESK